MNSDKIFVLSKGKIIEEGTHEELIKLNKKYKALQNDQIIEDQEYDESFNNLSAEEQEIRSFKKNLHKSSHISSEKRHQHISFNSGETKKNSLLKDYTNADLHKRLFIYLKNKHFGLFILIIIGIILGGITPLFSILFANFLVLMNDTNNINFNLERDKMILFLISLGVIALVGFLINS